MTYCPDGLGGDKDSVLDPYTKMELYRVEHVNLSSFISYSDLLTLGRYHRSLTLQKNGVKVDGWTVSRSVSQFFQKAWNTHFCPADPMQR